MTEEILCGDQGPFEGPFESFSLKRAYLKTPTDTYLLHVMFPRLARTLRRRVSDAGAAGHVPAVRVDFSGAGAVDQFVPAVPVAVAKGPLPTPSQSGAATGQLSVQEPRHVLDVGASRFGVGSGSLINAEESDEERNTGGNRGANRIEEDDPAPPA